MDVEEVPERDQVFGELAQRTRELMDAGLRSEIDLADVEQVSAELEMITVRLRKLTASGPLDIPIGERGGMRNHGNPVVGLRNPVAPPLHIERYPDGWARCAFHLGPLYEGPPGLVHGGISALILDQLLGEAAAAGGAPGMTGRLALAYRRPTPLGDLVAEAWIEQVDGSKTTVRGHLLAPDGDPTVEAEGLFVLPRWARGARDESQRCRTFE